MASIGRKKRFTSASSGSPGGSWGHPRRWRGRGAVAVQLARAAPPEQGGLASGLLNTTRQIGGALGLALLGTIAASHASGITGEGQAMALSAGYAAAINVGAVIFLATGVIGFLALPPRLGNPQPGETQGEAGPGGDR